MHDLQTVLRADAPGDWRGDCRAVLDSRLVRRSASVVPARGVWFDLLKEPTTDYCGDGRPEVLHWGADGSVWLNEEDVGLERAPERVRELMENRAERVLFFVPGKGATVQDVADLMARLRASIDDLHVGLITDRQIRSMTQTDHSIGCMGWPRSALTEHW